MKWNNVKLFYHVYLHTKLIIANFKYLEAKGNITIVDNVTKGQFLKKDLAPRGGKVNWYFKESW